MKLIQRMFALLLTGALLLPASLAAQAQAEEDDFAILKKLGILTPYGDGSYRLEAPVTRAAMAGSVLRLINQPEQLHDGLQYFHDVPKTHSAFHVANVASRLGLFGGYGDGTFRPDEQLTVEQAVSVLVRLLGYDTTAQGQGGYPVGYMTVAAEKGMLRGIKDGGGSLLSRGDMARLFLNCLELDLYRISLYDAENGVVRYDSQIDRNILSVYWNVYRKSGKVTAIPETRLSSDGMMAKDRIEIDGLKYTHDLPSLEGWLGKQVDYYYEEAQEDGRLMLLTEKRGKNEQLEIDLADLEDGTGQTVAYVSSSGRRSSVAVSGHADYIYNGRAVLRVDLLPLKEEKGWLRLLDNDGDGVFDVVFVYVYENIVVESYNAQERLLVPRGNAPPLRLKEYAQSEFISDKLVLDNVALDSGDVLSVFESRGEAQQTLIRMHLGNGSVRGAVTGRQDRAVAIDGVEYPLADASAASQYFIGMRGAFYLDFKNKLAGFDAEQTEGEFFAYLIGAKQTGLRKPKIRLSAQTGVADYETADHFLWNGGQIPGNLTELSRQIDGLPPHARIVKVKNNARGEVTRLYTIETFQNAGLANRRYVADAKSFGEFFIDENTAVFVYNGIEAFPWEERVTVTDLRYLVTNRTYSVAGFDISEDFVASAVYLAATGANPINLDSAIALVTGVSNALHQDEALQKLQMIHLGKPVEYLLANGSIGPVAVGDIVQFCLNADNQIIDLEFVLRLGANPAPTVINTVRDASSNAGNFASQFRVFFGKIYAKYGNRIVARLDASPLAANYLYDTTSFRITCYEKRSKRAYAGTHADIALAYSEGYQLVIYTRFGAARDIIVCID